MSAIYYTPTPLETVTHLTEAIFMSEHANIIMIYAFIFALLLKSHVLEATVLPTLTQVSDVTANFTQTQSLTLGHTHTHTNTHKLRV